MNTLKLTLSLLAVAALTSCSTPSTTAIDVSDNLRKSLAQAGYKDVSVAQDRAKGVVTLGGHVTIEADKAQAETIAKSIARDQVVANQIEVLPIGDEKATKEMNNELDKGIEANLKAALIQTRFPDGVKFTVTNRVVTVTGEVDSQSRRTQAEKLAADVLNVRQVVNELQVKGQKATSSN